MSHFREELFAQRRFRQLLFALATLSVVLGLVIVPVEAGSGQFQSVEDGLWWAVVTVTGVGYGDLVPVTRLGRLIGVILQVTSVGMLGLLIGMVSDKLGQRQERLYWKREFNQFDELHDRLDLIESQLKYLVRSEFDADESNQPETSRKKQ